MFIVFKIYHLSGIISMFFLYFILIVIQFKARCTLKGIIYSKVCSEAGHQQGLREFNHLVNGAACFAAHFIRNPNLGL